MICDFHSLDFSIGYVIYQQILSSQTNKETLVSIWLF